MLNGEDFRAVRGDQGRIQRLRRLTKSHLAESWKRSAGLFPNWYSYPAGLKGVTEVRRIETHNLQSDYNHIW